MWKHQPHVFVVLAQGQPLLCHPGPVLPKGRYRIRSNLDHPGLAALGGTEAKFSPYPQDHPEGIQDWTWRAFSLQLPARVVEMLDAGGVLQAPDLRITKRGRVVLDLKVKASPMGKRKESGAPLRIVSFDWGVKRILTAVVMERTAEGMVQISRPFFLHTDGLYEKLAVMRGRGSGIWTRRSGDCENYCV